MFRTRDAGGVIRAFRDPALQGRATLESAGPPRTRAATSSSTAKQLVANERLIRYLVSVYPTIDSFPEVRRDLLLQRTN